MEKFDFSNLEKILTKKGYNVHTFETKEEASDFVDKSIDGVTVGFGGSMTVKEMGLMERLEKHNTVLYHGRIKDFTESRKVMKEAMTTEVYISSVNGMAETGEIVNIDGYCNRVASIMYGHERVYLLIGQNKIAPDLDKAVFRARNIAAPLNTKRLNKKTPCAVTGKCEDCNSPDRICRGMSILLSPPSSAEYHIVFIRENLGF